MADPELYRHKEEVQGWKLRDPIRRLENMIQDGGLASAKDLEQIRSQAEAIVEDAVRFAEESPAPAPGALFEDLYAEQPSERVAVARR